MSFEARYFGRCGECAEAIIPGMEVAYIQDVLVHSSCKSSSSTSFMDHDGNQRRQARVICPKCHLEVSRLVDGICVDCA